MSFFYVIRDIEAERAPDDLALLVMGGEIDYSASPRLRERLDEHIAAGKRRLIIDLTEVTFIDSSAIGAIVGATAGLREAGGGSLSIVCGTENRRVLRILDIAGIDSLFELHHTREQAVVACAAAS